MERDSFSVELGKGPLVHIHEWANRIRNLTTMLLLSLAMSQCHVCKMCLLVKTKRFVAHALTLYSLSAPNCSMLQILFQKSSALSANSDAQIHLESTQTQTFI